MTTLKLDVPLFDERMHLSFGNAPTKTIWFNIVFIMLWNEKRSMAIDIGKD